MRRQISSPTPSFSDTPPPPPSSQPRTYDPMAFLSSGPSNLPGPVNLSPPYIDQFGIPGYGQPYFMDCMRELNGARERIKQLELENARISSERDTLRDVLNCKGELLIDPQLRSSTSSSASPPSVGFPPLETSFKGDPCPTRESHPKIRFWTQQDYNNFLDSPQGQRAHLERGQVGYLEELDGTIASPKRVETLRSCIRSVWLELARNNRAPQTWKGMDASSYKYFQSFVEEAHPLFKCAVDSWKLNTLSCSSYPAWRAHYLDETGKLLSKEARKRRRGAKTKVDPDDEDSLLSRKKQRISEDDLNTISTSEESCATTSTTSYSPASESTSPSTSPVSYSSTSEPETDQIRSLSAPSESSATTVAAAEDSLTLESRIVADETVTHVNPLDELARVASSLGISVPDAATEPPAPVPGPTSNPSNPENPKSTQSIPGSHPTTKLSDNPPPPALASNPVPEIAKSIASESHSTPRPSTKDKKTPKMRPGQGKNGRNLCAHRWLRAFKDTSKGTLTEFNQYYKGLSNQQQEAYEKEAGELVANDTWNKEAFNGTIY